MLDILIKHARIIDGSGAAAYQGEVGIRGDKLVMDPEDRTAARVIDAAGRVVCPGFIDAHSHGDKFIGTQDARMFKTPQGVTTELCGQCGGSQGPIAPERARETHDFFDFAHPVERMKTWNTFERVLEYFDSLQLTTNVKSSVGHRMLRMAAMGLDNRPATAKELENMKSMLREAMQAGAAGLSTGLIYVPGCYADTHEVVELAKVIEPYGGIYSSHMRNEAEGVVEAVQEVLDIGRLAGVRVDISHHKVLGKDNWGLQKKTLEMIARANERDGIHATCDQYPYTRNMTTLRACIPNWYFAQGLEAFVQKLREPSFRTELRREMEDPATPYDNYYRNAGGWEGVYISSAAKTPEIAGQFVSELAHKIGKDPWTAYFDLMIENNCDMGGVYCSMCEDDVCDIIRSPYCVVGSDGINKSWKGKGHPRGSSTFPHAINYFVREKKILSLEQMIHKMTGLTAQRLLVDNKGLLKDGYDADVLIIDYDNFKDTATYDEPNRLTEGLDYVIVGGKVVYCQKQFTGVYSGRVLAHTGGRK